MGDRSDLAVTVGGDGQFGEKELPLSHIVQPSYQAYLLQQTSLEVEYPCQRRGLPWRGDAPTPIIASFANIAVGEVHPGSSIVTVGSVAVGD